jgi:hypothetical protein
MTKRAQSSFEFKMLSWRDLVARFDGGPMTSDVGGLLLRETGRRVSLLCRLVQYFVDTRQPRNRLELNTVEATATKRSAAARKPSTSYC